MKYINVATIIVLLFAFIILLILLIHYEATTSKEDRNKPENKQKEMIYGISTGVVFIFLLLFYICHKHIDYSDDDGCTTYLIFSSFMNLF